MGNYLYTRLFDFDHFLTCKIVDNKLIYIPTDFQQKISENGIEILNKKDIVVFQLFLDKKTNTISMAGTSVNDKGYIIFTDSGFMGGGFPEGIDNIDLNTKNQIKKNVETELQRVPHIFDNFKFR